MRNRTRPLTARVVKEEDVRISGQTGGSVHLDNVFNLHFSIATAFDHVSEWSQHWEFSSYPDEQNTGFFVVTQGKFFETQKIFLTVFISSISLYLFTYFEIL